MKEIVNNPKQQAILESGKELFWKYGIKRVTVEEICREAGVSKMTYYKFFPNKPELAKTIYIQVVDDGLKKFNEIVHSNRPFPDKVKEMFALKLESVNDISSEFINDIFNNQELGLHKYVMQQQEKSLSLFVEFMKDAQKKGFVRKDISVEFILSYLQIASQMLNNPQLMSNYEHPQDFIMESMNFMFYGILSNNE